MIAQYITQTTGSVVNVAWYLLLITAISLASIFFIKDRSQEPLHTMSGH
ncbi:hypothetical protein [Mobilicoccus caccae]|nr:hypothetical protein [Mobilicoccus caccae]